MVAVREKANAAFVFREVSGVFFMLLFLVLRPNLFLVVVAT